RISWQITGVHSIRAVEPHEIWHRRRNKSATARHSHVHIRIRDHGATIPVHNLSVDARGVTALLFNHLKRTSLGQMSIAPARDRRLHHNAPAADQIRSLPAQIDLDAIRTLVLREQWRRDAK